MDPTALRQVHGFSIKDNVLKNSMEANEGVMMMLLSPKGWRGLFILLGHALETK